MTNSCSSCEAVMINNVYCHELSCPDAWRDYDIDCSECGCSFRPKTKWQRICSDDCLMMLLV